MIKILAIGNSMYPTMLDKNYYFMENIVFEDLHVKDIIVFQYQDMVISHRIVKKMQSKNGTIFLKTKGDNCVKADDFAVTKRMVLRRIII